jgi:pimeloyl-ACP methyl ester carboxylesterase
MHHKTLTTADGIQLNCAYAAADLARPWIVLVLPFGLRAGMAEPFAEFFESHYNVCTWESRSVLEASDRDCPVGEFSIDHHVADLLAVMDALGIAQAKLVGYCSGCGIALAAINLAPNRFSELVLAHGEYTLLGEAGCVTPFAADMDVLLTLASASDERARLVFDKIQAERLTVDVHRPVGLDQPFSDPRFIKRYACNYLAYKSVDFLELASQVGHPTLLLAGTKDMQVNISSSQRILARMHNASLFIDPDADHYGVLTSDSNTLIAIWNFFCEYVHVASQPEHDSVAV